MLHQIVDCRLVPEMTEALEPDPGREAANEERLGRGRTSAPGDRAGEHDIGWSGPRRTGVTDFFRPVDPAAFRAVVGFQHGATAR